MEFKEHCESRFSQLQEQLSQTPGIRGYFFLMYDLPNGEHREAMGTERTRLISEMYLKLLQTCKPYAEIPYMCRRIGETHHKDTQEPEIFVNKPLEELARETEKIIMDIRMGRWG